MDALECIRTRQSIRKFRADPVPKEILLSVISTALRSPSYKNSQPWEVVIVSGKKKEGLTNLLLGLLESGAKPAPDIPEPLTWPPEIEERISTHMTMRSEHMGIKGLAIKVGDMLSPEIMKKKAKAANFRFYGAPHGIFLYQDGSLTPWSIFDMGLFAQSLMLSAHAIGLGTVPQAFLTDYAKETKDFLGIPASKRLVLGISIGYPDMEDKANSHKSLRAGVGEMVKWVE